MKLVTSGSRGLDHVVASVLERFAADAGMSGGEARDLVAEVETALAESRLRGEPSPFGLTFDFDEITLDPWIRLDHGAPRFLRRRRMTREGNEPAPS